MIRKHNKRLRFYISSFCSTNFDTKSVSRLESFVNGNTSNLNNRNERGHPNVTSLSSSYMFFLLAPLHPLVWLSLRAGENWSVL